MSNIITKISDSNKWDAGERLAMYTVVQGKGSNRTSTTRHMTKRQAKALKDKLNAEGEV